tara:strand:+ start:10814 stop:11194 length:381 start_codon:yes stop_codon:yes gene_type:complete
MANSDKLKAFEVVRTPKIKDSEGNYVKRGETCKLTKVLAEHYHALGYIKVTMDDLFNEKSDPDGGTNTGPDGTQDPSGPSDAKPVAGAGADDAEETSDDAQDDAGASEAKAVGKHTSNRRRKRATG